MITAPEDASGHYRTAAAALAFVGVVGIGIGAIASPSSAEIGFIDTRALISFSVLFLAVAAGMSTYRDR